MLERGFFLDQEHDIRTKVVIKTTEKETYAHVTSISALLVAPTGFVRIHRTLEKAKILNNVYKQQAFKS